MLIVLTILAVLKSMKKVVE